MDIHFGRMDLNMAKQIANWKYREPYKIYSMDGTDECIQEFIDETYYCAYDNNGKLIGYICTGNSARVPGGYSAGLYEDTSYIDFGLGLRPDLTGKGIGLSFISEALLYLKTEQQMTKLRLVVASFNLRAIKVYEKSGFTKVATFNSKVNGEVIEFICMKLQLYT